MSKYIRKCSDKYNRRAVLQYSMNEELIREWKTVGEIHRELGFDKSAILRCCKGKQHRSYWFIWRFKSNVISAKKEIGKDANKSTAIPKAVQQVKDGNKKGD